jgi:hypothetical protein
MYSQNNFAKIKRLNFSQDDEILEKNEILREKTMNFINKIHSLNFAHHS